MGSPRVHNPKIGCCGGVWGINKDRGLRNPDLVNGVQKGEDTCVLAG